MPTEKPLLEDHEQEPRSSISSDSYHEYNFSNKLDSSNAAYESHRHRTKRSRLPNLTLVGSLVQGVCAIVTTLVFVAYFVNLLKQQGKADLGTSAGIHPDLVAPQQCQIGERRDCGESAVEARAAGCTFDPMALGWIHPDCVGLDKLVDKYYAEWPELMQFWTDPERTHRIPTEVVRSGNYPGLFWSPPDLHFMHCAYMLEMGLHQWHRGGLIVDLLYSIEHTEHCVWMLSHHILKPGNDTVITPSYYSCICPTHAPHYEDWTRDYP